MEGQVMVFQCLPVTIEAIFINISKHIAAQVHDPAAALVYQVFGNVISSGIVVDDNRRAGIVWMHPIEEYYGYITFKKRFQVVDVLSIVGKRDEQSIHPFIEHGGGIDLFFFCIFQRLCNDEVVPMPVGCIFHTC